MLNNKNIIAAILTAVGVFVFFALDLPEYDTIQQKRTTLQTRQAQLEERASLMTTVASLNSQYEQNLANINKLDTLLPTKNQQDQIVSSIQAITSQAGLNLSELSIADTSQPADTGPKPSLITLRASGQYEQFLTLLQLLEQNLRLYDVQAIGISEAANSGAASSRGLNFEVKINANSIKK